MKYLLLFLITSLVFVPPVPTHAAADLPLPSGYHLNSALASDAAAVHLVWRHTDYDFAVSRILYSRGVASGDALAWSIPTAVSGDHVEAKDPRVAVDQDGTPHIVWSNRDVVYHRVGDAVMRLGDGYSPDVAIDGGLVHVVWSDGPFVLQRQAGPIGVFGPLQTLANVGTLARNTRVAVVAGEVRVVIDYKYSDHAPFGVALLARGLFRELAARATNPAVAADGSMAWVEEQGDGYALAVVRNGARQSIQIAPNLYAANPALARDGDTLHIAYAVKDWGGRGFRSQVVYAGTVDDLQPISDSPAQSPTIAIHRGLRVVVWSETVGRDDVLRVDVARVGAVHRVYVPLVVKE